MFDLFCQFPFQNCTKHLCDQLDQKQFGLKSVVVFRGNSTGQVAFFTGSFLYSIVMVNPYKANCVDYKRADLWQMCSKIYAVARPESSEEEQVILCYQQTQWNLYDKSANPINLHFFDGQQGLVDGNSTFLTAYMPEFQAFDTSIVNKWTKLLMKINSDRQYDFYLRFDATIHVKRTSWNVVFCTHFFHDVARCNPSGQFEAAFEAPIHSFVANSMLYVISGESVMVMSATPALYGFSSVPYQTLTLEELICGPKPVYLPITITIGLLVLITIIVFIILFIKRVKPKVWRSKLKLQSKTKTSVHNLTSSSNTLTKSTTRRKRSSYYWSDYK